MGFAMDDYWLDELDEEDATVGRSAISYSAPEQDVYQPTASEMIEQDVAQAQHNLKLFINRLAAKHLLEMRAYKLPKGLYDYKVFFGKPHIKVIRFVTGKTAVVDVQTECKLQVSCSPEYCRENFFNYDTVSMEQFNIPGTFIVTNIDIRSPYSTDVLLRQVY